MRMKEVHFIKHQAGWRCQFNFMFTSRNQFSDEYGEVTSAVYRWWFSAWWNARISLKLFLAVNEATPADRAAKGWAA